MIWENRSKYWQMRANETWNGWDGYDKHCRQHESAWLCELVKTQLHACAWVLPFRVEIRYFTEQYCFPGLHFWGKLLKVEYDKNCCWQRRRPENGRIPLMSYSWNWQHATHKDTVPLVVFVWALELTVLREFLKEKWDQHDWIDEFFWKKVRCDRGACPPA